MVLADISRLLIPAAAAAYSAFMIFEQFTGRYGQSSRMYALVVGGLVIALCLLLIAQTLRARTQARADQHEEALPAPSHTPEITALDTHDERFGNLRSIGVFLVATAIMVMLLQPLGYVIVFTAFLAPMLVYLGVRPALRVVLISVITVAFVHFVFVKWFGLRLPAGVLQGII